MNADLPRIVGVYGGGRMGAGIAHAFLVAGGSVVVVENDDETAAAARARVDGSLAKAAERGTLGERPCPGCGPRPIPPAWQAASSSSRPCRRTPR